VRACDQPHASLIGSCTVKRELVGGEMSRVFVAVETALDREVVIKLLARASAMIGVVRRTDLTNRPQVRSRSSGACSLSGECDGKDLHDARAAHPVSDPVS
jgi:hypothetical protein